MHDALFGDQLHLTEQDLAARAEQVHLNVTTFAQCMAGTAAQKVKADVETAAKLNVSGTPTFFIGNVLQDGRLQAQYRLSGAQGFAAFQAFLDKLIAYPPSNPSRGQAKRPETR
jgi:protein-disulfide isomerase